MTEGETTDTTLTITRTFDAPRAQVWDAWTDPDHLDQWWGPDGFTTTTHEMNVRPGGQWRFVMVGPDGAEYQNLIEYTEVTTPEFVAYIHGSPEEPEQFTVTVTFDDHGDDQTHVTMQLQFPTAEALDEAIEFGAIEGANQTLAKLAQHLTTTPRN